MPVVALIAMLGVTATDLSDCEGFSGTYREVGVVEQASGALPKGGNVLLSLAVFRQAMPGLERPESVILSASPDDGVLRVTLVGTQRFEMTFPVTCAQGAYRIERLDRNAPAGEGIDLVRYTETILLRPDATGLDVRVMSEGRYRTWPFFHRTEKHDDRYRFTRESP